MSGKPLSDKVALITGSSRGIGKAIALRMAELGADTAITCLRSKSKAHETAEEIEEMGRRTQVIKANVADEDSMRNMFDEVREGLGKLDIFVANAASASFESGLDYTVKKFDYAMRANPRAYLIGVQEAFRLFVERAGHSMEEINEIEENGGDPPEIGGKIIAISSTGNQHYIPKYIGVATSKAAMITMSRYFAYELGKYGTNVNVVSGGPVNTRNMKRFPEDLRERWQEQCPEGRIGEPEDIAGVAAYLATPDADWINGENITADGGLGLA